MPGRAGDSTGCDRAAPMLAPARDGYRPRLGIDAVLDELRDSLQGTTLRQRNDRDCIPVIANFQAPRALFDRALAIACIGLAKTASFPLSAPSKVAGAPERIATVVTKKGAPAEEGDVLWRTAWESTGSGTGLSGLSYLKICELEQDWGVMRRGGF